MRVRRREKYRSFLPFLEKRRKQNRIGPRVDDLQKRQSRRWCSLARDFSWARYIQPSVVQATMRRILGVRQGRVRGPVTGFLPGQDCSHAQKHRTSRACGILKRPSAPAGHFARPYTNPSCGARCAFLVRVDLARTRDLLAPVCNCPAKQSGADLPSVLVYPIPRRLRHFSFTRMQFNCPRGRCLTRNVSRCAMSLATRTHAPT